jgi:hypothetical protein
MGSPEYLRRQEVERLEEASRLRRESPPWRYEAGRLFLDVRLTPHAVAAIRVEFTDGE